MASFKKFHFSLLTIYTDANGLYMLTFVARNITNSHSFQQAKISYIYCHCDFFLSSLIYIFFFFPTPLFRTLSTILNRSGDDNTLIMLPILKGMVTYNVCCRFS